MTTDEKKKELDKLIDRQVKLMFGCDLVPITDKPKPSGK
jgi:hypothetical protein